MCWVLLLGVLIVSGTVRSSKAPKHGDDDAEEDNNGDESGDGDDGRYLVQNIML